MIAVPEIDAYLLSVMPQTLWTSESKRTTGSISINHRLIKFHAFSGFSFALECVLMKSSLDKIMDASAQPRQMF